jgi:hypothetical protein
MVQLTFEEKIFVFENRIQLLSNLLKMCQIDQNLGFFFWEEIHPFDPENIQKRLEKGIQDTRPVSAIISEANLLWDDIKKEFLEGIVPLDMQNRCGADDENSLDYDEGVC